MRPDRVQMAALNFIDATVFCTNCNEEEMLPKEVEMY